MFIPTIPSATCSNRQRAVRDLLGGRVEGNGRTAPKVLEYLGCTDSYRLPFSAGNKIAVIENLGATEVPSSHLPRTFLATSNATATQ